MKSVEVSAKSKEMAIMDGLNQLEVSYDKVKIEVLSEGGLFSKCRLRMTVIEEDEDLIEVLRQPIKNESAREIAQRAVQAKANQAKVEQRVEKAIEPKKQPHQQSKRNNQSVEHKKPQEKPFEKKPKENEEKVFVALSEQKIQQAEGCLKTLLEKMNFSATVTSTHNENELILNIECEDAGSIIGYRGETLDALQVLIHAAVELEGERKIVVNCQQYRERRAKTLCQLAERMAQKSISTGRKMRLEPMSSFERRIIHAHLSDNSEVFTRSEGNDPTRHVVIFPKNRSSRQNNNRRPNRTGNPLGGSTAFSENARPADNGFSEFIKRN